MNKLRNTLEQRIRDLERAGKTVLIGSLKVTQKILDVYSDRLPFYFERAPHHGFNEPYKTVTKNFAAVAALGLGSFVGLRAFELMHTPEIYSALSASVENLPTVVKFLAKEASGPLVGFLVGSSGGYILGYFVGGGVSAGLHIEGIIKEEITTNNGEKK